MKRLIAAILLLFAVPVQAANVSSVKVCDGITLTKSTTTDCTAVELPAARFLSYQVYCNETTDNSMKVSVDFVNGSSATVLAVPSGVSQLLTDYTTEAAWSAVEEISAPYAQWGTIRFTESNDDADIVCSAIIMYPTQQVKEDDFFVTPQWDDTMTPALSTRVGGTSPGDCNFLGDSTLAKAYCFDGGTAVEEVHFTLQIPHSYRVGSTLKPHVHWSPTTTDAGNVVWQLEYTISEIGGTFPSSTTVSCTASAAGGTAWTHNIAACPDIVDTGLGISSIMYGRLFRNGAATGDTYDSHDAAMIGFDIHYEMDAPGSSAATSK